MKWLKKYSQSHFIYTRLNIRIFFVYRMKVYCFIQAHFAVHLPTILRSSGGEIGLVRKSLHPALEASNLSLS